MKRTISLLLSMIMLFSITSGMSFETQAANVTASQIVSYAKSLEGKPYVLNTHGPDSFDCSGFVYYVFKQKGITLSTASSDYWDSPTKYGTKVTGDSNAQPGYICVWSGHVGICIGSGKVVNALNPSKGVCEMKITDYINSKGTLNPSHFYIKVNGVNYGGNSTANVLTIYYNTNEQGYISSESEKYCKGNDGSICLKSNNKPVSAAWTYDVGNKDGLYNASTFGLKGYGYTFVGWSTSKSGGKVFDQDDSSVKPSDLNPNIKNGNCSVTLYAVWKPNVLTVIYNANGGVIESNQYYLNGANTVCLYSTGAALKDLWEYDETHSYGLYNASTFGLYRPGYVFSGWISYDQKTVGTSSITIGEDYAKTTPSLINSSISEMNCTSTLYAKWTVCSHTYDSGKVTKAPTTTSTGVKTYICTVCGDTKTETIPKLEETPLSGWVTDGGKTYYYKDGNAVTGWQLLKKNSSYNAWYYFDPNGQMLKSTWIVQGTNERYYLGSNGAMQTGWQKISGSWYYFNGNGKMLTGWQKIGSVWYYFNAATDRSGGDMVTGWKKINSKWYYFNSSGAMQTGWIKLSGKWYYLESSGAMRTANLTYKGKVYKFNSSGVCLNP